MIAATGAGKAVARAVIAAAVGLLALACGSDPAPSPSPDLGPSLLPADYGQRFTQVRACRSSIEHFPNILVKTDPALVARYNDGPFPFAVGDLIVKEEFSDHGCTALTGYTLMRKEAPGYDPRYGDWHWQRLDAAGTVVADGKGDGALAVCASCHLKTPACQLRDFTCTEP
jgi:hypothetical protein